MFTLEAKIYAFLAVLALIVFGAAFYTYHERHLGAAACQAADTKAVDAERAKQVAQHQADLIQLGDADAKLKDALQTIADLRVHAGTHLVCHQADSHPVPLIPAPAGRQPAPAGNAADVRQPDFDPAPALADLSAAYERRVETARDALDRWPNSPQL